MVWLGSVGSGAVVSSIGLVGFVDLVGWGGVVCLCGMVVLLFGLVRLLCPVGRFPMVTVVGSVGLVGLLGAVGLVGLRCSVCGGREKGEGGRPPPPSVRPIQGFLYKMRVGAVSRHS